MDIAPATRVSGEVLVPGDKSISHRALLLGGLAGGRTYLGNLSPAADVASTAACMSACGASVRNAGDGRAVCEGAGRDQLLRSPAAVLDCGNSATTMRLLAGVLAGQPIDATLDGDESLRRRPMARVTAALERMGARLDISPWGTAPMRVRGRRPLTAVDVTLAVASAQVKSAVLLAGMSADGPVTVREPAATRDHTERMLRMCGIEVTEVDLAITVVPARLAPFGMRIPGDLSAAAFLLCLAAALPGSEVRCPGVTLNPGRTGILEVLAAMGVAVTVEPDEEAAGGVEPVGTVAVRGGPGLRGARVDGALVPRLIDEIPVLAVLATQAEGITSIRDAAELRVKESDRIALLAAGLRALGADVEEHPDGLDVSGPARLRGALLESHGDHRLAMAWAVAATVADPGAGPSRIGGADACGVSYPDFFRDLARLSGP